MRSNRKIQGLFKSNQIMMLIQTPESSLNGKVTSQTIIMSILFCFHNHQSLLLISFFFLYLSFFLFIFLLHICCFTQNRRKREKAHEPVLKTSFTIPDSIIFMKILMKVCLRKKAATSEWPQIRDYALVNMSINLIHS